MFAKFKTHPEMCDSLLRIYRSKIVIVINRGFFEKDGILQTGELINIANGTVDGELAMVKKLKHMGFSEAESKSILLDLLQ